MITSNIIKCLVVCLICFLFGCSNDDCQEDSVFKSEFRKQIDFLDGFSIEFKAGDTDIALDAVSFLNAVTETRSNIYLGDIIFYDRRELLIDKEKWEKWYKENGCFMTMDKADSLYKVNWNLRPNAE